MKLEVEELPLVVPIEPWDYRDFMKYLEWRYDDYKAIKPIKRRNDANDIDEECTCLRCGAPASYLYRNNGSKRQFLCKVCGTKSMKEKKHNAKMYKACVML